MNYPEYVKIEDKKYKINTDFRVALECQKIALDETIGDYERPLAIIYTLFGEEGLDDFNNHVRLLELAMKYLKCGNENIEEHSNEEPDMDFEQDMDYIEASFMSDYNIDLSTTKMHWWKFANLLNGLSNSEMGNCCVLNHVRNLRTYDTSQIKDLKERERIEKAKKQVALKKKIVKKELNKEQQKNVNDFYESLGRA